MKRKIHNPHSNMLCKLNMIPRPCDIIVYYTSPQHPEHAEKVFENIRRTNVKIQLHKCEFLKNNSKGKLSNQ